jgi:hypothetical protein
MDGLTRKNHGPQMIIDVKSLFEKIRKEGFLLSNSLLSNFTKSAPETWDNFFRPPIDYTWNN